MRKYFFLVLLSGLLACSSGDRPVSQGSYVPTIAKLTSDVMTPEVLWTFGRLGEPSVSPDGTSVAYTITYFNIEEDKSYRDIYLLKTGDKSVSRLTDTPEREFNIQWRPDGKKIGFLSSASGSVQIWEMVKRLHAVKPGSASRQ